MNKLTNFVTIALTGFIITSCENNDLKGDTSPPGKLLIESVVSTSGGGVIFYNLPSDADVLFVRADYKNAQNDEVYRVSSKDNDSIEISGLIDTTPVNINLSVFDTSQNQSESVTVELTPLRSFIFDVLESVVITPDLGGVRVNWINNEEKTVFIYVTIVNSDGEEEVRILSSNNKNGARFVRGLPAEEQNFSIKVEDFDGNSTPDTDYGSYTPLFEEKIDKSIIFVYNMLYSKHLRYLECTGLIYPKFASKCQKSPIFAEPLDRQLVVSAPISCKASSKLST